MKKNKYKHPQLYVKLGDLGGWTKYDTITFIILFFIIGMAALANSYGIGWMIFLSLCLVPYFHYRMNKSEKIYGPGKFDQWLESREKKPLESLESKG